MFDKSSSRSPASSLQAIARELRLIGWIGFWIQLVLVVICSLILLFAAVSGGRNDRFNSTNPGTGPGLFFTLCGILVLCFSIYWSFRYTRIARRLRSPEPSQRPSKGNAIQVVRIGLIVNLAGMLLTLLGTEAIVGGLLAKSLTQPQGVATFNDPTRLIQSLDIFVVQASINVVAAQFVGIATSLWLFQQVNRH
ncbi:MAG TPA: hypothetical protein DEV81_09830 [Cyanobacteria bacterium UBA11049]|nr:hypothetical protein [Cyanobacteria bacterium UBA11049]